MLLAGPVSHTSTQYIDFVEIFNISLDFLLFILIILVGVELPLCIVVTLSKNAISLDLSAIYFAHFSGC